MSDFELRRLIARQAETVVVGPELSALRDRFLQRYGGSLSAILFYGSCRRGGDVLEGLVDLYVVVDGYRGAYNDWWLTALNWLLPPNVFYLEVPLPRGRLRAKYALLSVDDLLKGTSSHWFHSYLWGRFAQPVAVLYARDRQVAKQLNRALAQAVATFVKRTVPVVPKFFNARMLWEQGLALSYRAELRAEQPQRNTELFVRDQAYYEALTRAALAAVPYPAGIESIDGETWYRVEIPERVRRIGCRAWLVRRGQGKMLSLLRLAKAVFTFRGGVDYVLWKLERHSGVRIEASARVRRHPLVYGWGLMWRLYRRGIFR